MRGVHLDRRWIVALSLAGLLCPGTTSQTMPQHYDCLIRNGTVYDGSGQPPRVTSVAIRGDQIAAIGALAEATAALEVDAQGLAVAPGFINFLSWANESLLHDGRSQSNLRQGVTLEVLGEGTSMGPLTAEMKRDLVARQADIQFPVVWTTLAEYLEHLEQRGISCNVASFVGAATVRIHELGYANRAPDAAELARMQTLVRQAMAEGAVGLSSALIYTPGVYAKTSELIALARVAGEAGGLYATHLRSEGDRLLEAIDECITIARSAHVPAHIYHLKAAGRANWPKLEAAISKLETARARGLAIGADMYCYTAAATGLDAAMPPWVQEGGYEAWAARLQQPHVRTRVREEMRRPARGWENLYLAAGSATNVLLVGFRNPALQPLTGQTLAAVAQTRGKSPEETAMDLVVEDGSRVATVYFLMSEENVRRQLRLPWVTFDSDEASLAPEGVFLKTNPHPRAYGNFARLLGKYVREEGLLPLTEAIRRLTWLPAELLRLDRRGALRPGCYADIVVFDPATIRDRATYDAPHQYATGVLHVFVNGVHVVREGEHTGATPGRVVRGPGYRGPLPR
ncbi:MAG: D-aminoacylase [Verrucomicrobia bacterium]|nr:D-aminoacylase [Verrucomicrobiota bacterium]